SLAVHSNAPGDATVAVQPAVPGDLELLIGVRNDTDFGSVVVVGLGGVYAEVIDEVSIAMGPVTVELARDMLDRTRAGTLLAGVRGRGPYDVAAVCECIARLSELAGSWKGVIE